jgi:hypothetical protein
MEGMMRYAFFALVLASPAFAQEAGISDTINGQMEAFRAEDVATAFDYASPLIQGIFGTPDNFGKMVREGYPMVWKPGDVTLMELRTVAGALWQRVRVTDASGRGWYLDYRMIQGPKGWLIDAVQLLPMGDLGA